MKKLIGLAALVAALVLASASAEAGCDPRYPTLCWDRAGYGYGGGVATPAAAQVHDWVLVLERAIALPASAAAVSRTTAEILRPVPQDTTARELELLRREVETLRREVERLQRQLP